MRIPILSLIWVNFGLWTALANATPRSVASLASLTVEPTPTLAFLPQNFTALDAALLSSPQQNFETFSLLLAQDTPSDPATSPNPLFVPQHRKQPGRLPFQPTLLPTESGENPPSTPATGSPGITIGVPSGSGASWRQLGMGLGIQSRARFTEKADGTFGLSMGFGDPVEAVGFQVGLGLVDLTNPIADGTVSLKLHRQLPYDLSIAVGATGVLTWGGPDGGSSIYGAATKRFTLREADQAFSQVTTTFGLGSGQFRSEDAIDNDRNEIGVFSSVAVRVAPPVSSIIEWTGQDLSIGLSITPVPQIPLVITPAVADITGSAGDGARFIIGIGYGFSF